MLHECKDYLRDDACIVCEASLGVVNVLRRLRNWEQVIEGAFTKDQIAFDLKRLLETHEDRPTVFGIQAYALMLARTAQNRLERDRSVSESPTVTFEAIPAHTRAGLMRISKLLRIVRSICSVQDALAERFNGDRLEFWNILVGHIPVCQESVDDLLSVFREVPFKGSDTVDSRPMTPLPLLQGVNDLVPVQQLHAVPAYSTRERTRRAAAAPPVAAAAPAVAQAGRPIAGTKRFKRAQSSRDDSTTKALDTKVNEVAQRTAVERDGRKYIPRYRCLFCGWSGREDQARVDHPNNHRTGQTLTRCKVYESLGGESNPFRVASFLIARWPELLERDFVDNQILPDSKLHKALHGYQAKNLSSKAQLALAKYKASKKSPPAGSGYQDDALFA